MLLHTNSHNNKVENINKDPEPTHICCRCSPDVSLCGIKIPDNTEEDYSFSNDCVVCLDLEKNPCKNCGITWYKVLKR